MRISALLLFGLLCSRAMASDIAPEPESDWIEKTSFKAQSYIAVTADARATAAATSILHQGGSAIDAAIAAQMVLNLVEPQSSGIGGGGFLLYYDVSTDTLTSFDGRETAPAAADPEMFLDKHGKPFDFMKAVRSGNAVGTPGLLAMLELAHDQYGILNWSALFDHAIHLAKEGFVVSPRLHDAIVYAQKSDTSSAFNTLYLDGKGGAIPVGKFLRNAELADTFRDIQKKGADAFYRGERAERIEQAVRAHDGTLSTYDLEGYPPIERLPVCGDYRDNTICGMDAPSSGGITLLSTLGMLEYSELTSPYDAAELHLILEAQKRAFADRNRYITDPAFSEGMISEALLDERYLKKRAKEITSIASGKAKPGEFDIAWGADASFDAPATTHISIVDSEGNVASLTSSVEHSFGSGIVVDGFVLNNQLTDFSFTPEEGGKPVANAVAPEKRPRSSMTPTIVFGKNGKVRYVLGSPGGHSITPYVTKTLIALIDWQMRPQAAVNAPHFMHKNGVAAEIEEGNEPLAEALREMGHNVTVKPFSSGVNLIAIEADGRLIGAADPRREGSAMGE